MMLKKKMSQNNDIKTASFWEHLDELKGGLVRITLGVIILGTISFFFKNELFSVILAPQNSNFITYRLFDHLSNIFPLPGAGVESFSVKLINTQLAQQFLIHIKMSMYAGFLLIFPYILYELFKFVSPALYDKERKYAFWVIISGYIMFMLGVLLSYFLIFPLTFRFLGTYQVSPMVENYIAIDSYISTMMTLSLMMGIVFEIPILSWLFAKMGFISASFLRKYRKHAIIILLVIAAIITPTSDIFTLLIVSLPIYTLYELSILLIAISNKPKIN